MRRERQERLSRFDAFAAELGYVSWEPPSWVKRLRGVIELQRARRRLVLVLAARAFKQRLKSDRISTSSDA